MVVHEPVLTNLGKCIEFHFDDASPGWLVAVAMHFTEGMLVTEVNPDDDTVDLRLTSEVDLRHWPDAVQTDRSQEPSWSTRLGFDCIWRWTLTNHQGYQDGVQIELSRGEDTVALQRIAVASRFSAAQVSES